MANSSKPPLWLVKWLNYEYWPYWVFYAPVFPLGVLMALRNRSLTYFTAANPGMPYGGLFHNPKSRILRQLPEQYLPNTIWVQKGTAPEEVLAAMTEQGIGFPCIVKPDVGERGRLVEQIADARQLAACLAAHPQDLLVQEYIGLPFEAGVFFYRFPDGRCGISSVVVKEFLTVTGNGRDTLKTLIGQSLRARFRQGYLETKFADRLGEVLPEGESLLLEPIGNHNRGTKFKNGNALINTDMVAFFDQFSRPIQGYYYGRFDLRMPSPESLYTGHGLKVMELNGVNSEPAHIYDPDTMTLRTAYRDVIRHIRLAADISLANLQRGVKPSTLSDFLGALYRHFFSAS
jgi:hypothetical protein